jgi:hypothetical protein
MCRCAGSSFELLGQSVQFDRINSKRTYECKKRCLSGATEADQQNGR